MNLNIIISYITVLILILLIILVIKYENPKQEMNESDEDYQKRLNNYRCNYKGNRNALLAGLILSIGIYWFRMLKPTTITGASEKMDDDEPNLYKYKESVPKHNENVVSDGE